MTTAGVSAEAEGRSAVLSPCGRYRYRLEHRWDSTLRTLGFVMLNPSTADHQRDDPTVRRCAGFARQWGFGGLVVTNLFALRAPDPRVLFDVVAAGGDPIGPDNAAHLHAMAAERTVVVAWGARADAVLGEGYPRATADRLAVSDTSVVCLGRCRDGAPRHPLYVASSTALSPWDAR